MNTSLRISDVDSFTDAEIQDVSASEDPMFTFTFSESSGEVTSMFELSTAEINIFDSDYYINSNPDIAANITNEAENIDSVFTFTRLN